MNYENLFYEVKYSKQRNNIQEETNRNQQRNDNKGQKKKIHDRKY
ncbi:hypothetical protein pb186bvf_009768 [Paramecium bursaria]